MNLKNTVSIIAIATLLQFSGAVCFAADLNVPAVKQASKNALSVTKEEFIQGMGARVLGVLKDEKKGFEEKQATLRKLFVEVVDTNWIAKFVLGKAWKEATPEQKAKYTELYRTYLTETYISKFDDDSGSKVKDIKINGVKDASDGTFTAHTEIVQSGTEPAVKVDYLLREKGGEFKVIDINIEGISLLATHRQEFSALAASNGIDGVIQKLTELTTHKG